jgi:opacity protein-like surface antigen
MLVFLFLLPVSLSYSSERQNHYIGIEGGLFFPLSGFNYNGNFDFNTGNTYGIKYTSYLFNDWLGVSFRAGNTNFTSKTKKFSDYREHFELHGVGLATGLAFRYPLGDFDLLAEGGLVFNANTADNVFESSSGKKKQKNSGSAVGLYLEAGTRYNITDTFNVGALFRYTYDDQKIQGYLHNVDMSGLSLMLTLGLSFDFNSKTKIITEVHYPPFIPEYGWYVVKENDDLEHISTMFYGHQDYWPLIYCVDYNRPQIKRSPNLIYPGQKLKIITNPTVEQKRHALEHNHPKRREIPEICSPPLDDL